MVGNIIVTINNLKELQNYKEELSKIKVWVCNTACGKSYLCDIDDRFYVLDLYRSKIKNSGEVNYEDLTIPQMYNVMGGGQIVLNAAHGHFLNYLDKNKIPFVYVYSKPECQEEYINRMLHRGSGQDFVDRFGHLIAEHYKNRVKDDRATYKIEMNSGEFVSEYIWQVFGMPKKYIQNPVNVISPMYDTVFCDIDGTLLNREKNITDFTKYVISKIKNSVNFVLVSARSKSRIMPILSELGLDKHSCYIAFNGSQIYKGNELIFDDSIKEYDSKIILKYILDYCDTQNFECTLYLEDQKVNLNNINDINQFLTANKIYKIVLSASKDVIKQNYNKITNDLINLQKLVGMRTAE